MKPQQLPRQVMVSQAAEYLGVTTKAVRNMIDRGELIAQKLPGKTSPYLIDCASLIVLKEKRDQSKTDPA